jgi:hypothetical protein
MISFFPPTADMTNPLLNALAKVVRSGLIPKCCCAPPGDTLNPVTTSSKIKGMLFSLVIFLKSERNFFQVKLIPY